MNIEITEDGQVICAWFARCSSPTTTALEHPVLGPVPCCKRCAGFTSSQDKLQPFELVR